MNNLSNSFISGVPTPSPELFNICNQIHLSQIPRYHELIPLKADKKNVPGPGSYNIKSTLERHVALQAEGSDAKPFGSTTKRFISPKTTAPAPGQYNETRHAFESLRK